MRPAWVRLQVQGHSKLHRETLCPNNNNKLKGWRSSSTINHLPGLAKALGLIPLNYRKQEKNGKNGRKEKGGRKGEWEGLSRQANQS